MRLAPTLALAGLSLLCACEGTADPLLGVPAPTTTAKGGVPGGGGNPGGGADACAGLQLVAPLYVVQAPLANEPVLGGLVHATCQGTTNLPADTAVTVNGVALVAQAGDFRASAAGTQVALGADSMLHVRASSASTGASAALDLPCPASLALAADPAPGSSLAGVGAVTVSWAALPLNPAGDLGLLGPYYGQPTIQLDSLDLATLQPAGIIDQPFLTQDATAASLVVRTRSASSGYLVALTYPGPITASGGQAGYCGRSPRLTFAR